MSTTGLGLTVNDAEPSISVEQPLESAAETVIVPLATGVNVHVGTAVVLFVPSGSVQV